VVSSTTRPHVTPGKDPVPILQEAGWAPGLVGTGGKPRPHRDSIPDRPARSQSLYRLSYPAHIYIYIYNYYKLGDMFRFTEPSSGQILTQRNGTFSQSAHYGIPYCLQTIFDIKFMLHSVGRCTEIYVKLLSVYPN